MEKDFLIKTKWTKKDIPQFLSFLSSFSKGEEKGMWEQRIVNTALPCIAVPSDKVKEITNTIAKGNFLSFVDLWIWDNHTTTVIAGGLICKIKDFELQKKYLETYSKKVDNWASIDCLKFKFTTDNTPLFFEFAKTLLKNEYEFCRRLGIIILLKLCSDKNLIDQILKLLPTLYGEEKYYVNMATAWLVAECFTKHKDKTKPVFEKGILNKFANNKAISKCRDSFRVTKEDKEWLIKYRK